MIELALWLVVVGLCDLVRAARDLTTIPRRLIMAGLGVVLLAFSAIVIDVDTGRAVLLWVGWVVFFLLWLLGSTAAMSSAPSGSRTIAARAAAFVGLGGGVVFCLLAGGVAEPSRLPPGALEPVAYDDLLLVVGVGLVQLATANVAVRLLLDVVGVPAAANEKQLKGGRVLGPMERLFIVGLGLAGQLTAAAVVVAAKGLLRFPELQRGAKTGGPSDVSEYFLIGSFASWLVALGGLGLLALT